MLLKNKNSRNILTMLCCFFAFMYFVNGGGLNAASTDSIRVGLAPPETVYTSIDVSFSGTHALYSRYGGTELYRIDGGAEYVMSKRSGKLEVSRETFKTISDVDLSNYPNAVPMASSRGLKLVNRNNFLSAGSKEWANSEIIDTSFCAAESGGSVKFLLADSKAAVQALQTEGFKFYKSPYRGSICFYFEKISGLFPINHLDMESYLYGVVAKEMPSSWSFEALKAQAVCARTYAMASMGGFSEMDYDVAPTTVSQVYGGILGETENTNRAVDETRFEELFYGNERVNTFFHANNGGFASASEDAFSEKLPYFSPKVDQYSKSISDLWEVKVDKAELSKYLESKGENVGEIIELRELKINPSRRVESLKVKGSLKTVEITGAQLRYALNLRSTYFFLEKPVLNSNISSETNFVSVISSGGLKKIDLNKSKYIKGNGSIQNCELKIGDFNNVNLNASGLTVYGYGFGHGLGLSQWGAKVMAESGKNYDEILSFYYEGAKIKR